MSRPRPPYLLRQTNGQGKTVWYVRKGKGARIRIRGDYGSPEFLSNYHAAVSGETLVAANPGSRNRRGTFDWLVSAYRASPQWLRLADSTRYKHDKIFKQVSEAAGSEPLHLFTRAVIVEGRDRRRSTPNQARHYLDALRGLFGWAASESHATGVIEDPTAGVKNISIPKTAGFQQWSEADIQAFERAYPRGTRERVWLDVIQYTGLRRGDAVRLGPAHVGDGLFSILTEKSGFKIEAHIPIHPDLWASLQAGPIGEETFIVNAYGKPFTKESFGNTFSDAARKAGVNKSAHGIRKTAATRSAEKSATTEELKALFGWESDRMASHYTKNADRKRLAENAKDKIGKRKAVSLVRSQTIKK